MDFLKTDTMLKFPLNDVWFASSNEGCPINARSYKAVKVNDIFRYEALSQWLIFRPLGDPARRFPQLSLFQKAICTHRIYLFPFLAIQLLPTAISKPIGDIASSVTLSAYCNIYALLKTLFSILSSHYDVQYTIATLEATMKKFRKMKLNFFRVKNIWYHLFTQQNQH